MSDNKAYSMQRAILCFLAVLVIIFVVPIVVYGIFSAATAIQPPGNSPYLFLLGVFVSKAGTAAAFVFIVYFARESLSRHWLLYAAMWWLMFVLGEVGQAIGPNYSWAYAIAGIISETIYLPLSAYLTSRLIKKPETKN